MCIYYLVNLPFKTSYIIIPPATEAFKELIFPIIGIFTNKSHFLSVKLEIPFPSLPIINAHGPENQYYSYNLYHLYQLHKSKFLVLLTYL